MTENFKQYSQCYDLLYSEKDYQSEVFYVINKLHSFKNEIKTILNLGSGTGKHDEYFLKSGYDTIGIELSDEMSEIANSRGFLSQVGDMSNFNLNRKFDCVVSLFHVVSYLNTNEQIINMFKCVYNHLEDNGIFLFDVWFTPAVYSQKPEKRMKHIENDSLRINRIATPEIDYENNIVQVEYKIDAFDKKHFKSFSFSETHKMRHFGVSEINMLAQLGGLSLIDSEEFLTKNLLSDKTWGACFTFIKNGK
jgi:SAM-dependent methyltransferase